MRMRAFSVLGGIAAGTLIVLGAFGAALAQDEPQSDDSQVIEQLGEDSGQSPPGRVAQLSDAEGSVSLQPAGTTSWINADLNRPLTLGDKLWADQNSRAELDIGDAVIRLGSTTGLSFLNLDDQTAQMQVTAGTVIVHVRTLSNGEDDEIDTPNIALTLQQPGVYRVEVSDTGDSTLVEVEDGSALATGGGQSYPVAAQQSVTFTGTNTLAANYATLGAPDSLDEWSMQRDQQAQQQAAATQQYVSPQTVGGSDLGSYGTWQDTPDWGYAWFPAVAVGWAPYSLGRWVWISPWGWTWVDQEPWGFAPFHYGRWGYWGRRWCWIPGPRLVRPMYAPALVAWVGGPNGGVSVSGGPRVGWFPLGPRDVYVPGYRVGPAYVRNINITNTRIVNTTYITNVYEGRVNNVTYANSAVPGAITAVPRNVFTSAEPIGPHRVTLHQGGGNLRATTSAPAIAPVRQSVLGANAGGAVRTPPRALIDRPVVARLAPPRAPVSFDKERTAIRANGGRPLPMSELSRMRPNTPVAPVRLSAPSTQARPGMELRTAPQQNRGAPAGGNTSARERALQQPSLPPPSTPRNDRPPWSQAGPMRPQRPATQPRPSPERQQAPLEWRTPPEQAPREQRFSPPARQVPDQRFNPPERQVPEQRFNPPERQVPEQRFNPPERQVPDQRFSPPERQVPEQRFSPPPEREAPQQRFAPPPREERAPAPRAAPPSRPEPRSEGRSPPHVRADRRAEAVPVPGSLGAGYAEQWQSPPPMYRPQENTIRYASPPQQAQPADAPYHPPVSPPPMYRPIPVGGAAASTAGAMSRIRANTDSAPT